MELKEIGEWKFGKFDDPKQLLILLNSLHLKKEDILYTEKNKETGEIEIIYFF